MSLLDYSLNFTPIINQSLSRCRGKEHETTKTGYTTIGTIQYTWSKKVPCMIK